MNATEPPGITFPLFYWVDHGVSPLVDPTGAIFSNENTTSLISISIDPTLRPKVSGIRLVIVSVIQDVILEDYDHKLWNSPHRDRTYSSRAMDIRDTGLPIPTLVLELQVDLHAVRSIKTPLQLTPKSSPLCSRTRILFDKHLTTVESLNSPYTVRLRSTHPFTSWLCQGQWPRTGWSNTFSILPTSSYLRATSSFNRLPRRLIHIVTQNTCDEFYSSKSRNIRDLKGILSIALVCKEWKSVVEVYFQQIGARYGSHQIHNPQGVIQSLRYQPRMCDHIRSFSSLKVAQHAGFYTSCAELIGLCTLLESLYLVYPVYRLAKNVIAPLIHVQTLTIPFPWHNKGEKADTVYEIYEVIKGWTRLEKLTITICTDSSSDNSCAAESFSACFALKELSVQSFNSPTHDIKHLFCLLQPNPTLTFLKLKDIKGISTADLRKLLTYLAPTLEQLKIRDCLASQEADDREAPIDAVLPHLNKIRQISASYPFATHLAISRKQPCVTNNSTVSATNLKDTCCRFKWVREGLTEFAEVTRALEVTGWSAVVLVCNPSADTQGPPSDVVNSWVEIAKRRGMPARLEISYAFQGN